MPLAAKDAPVEPGDAPAIPAGAPANDRRLVITALVLLIAIGYSPFLLVEVLVV